MKTTKFYIGKILVIIWGAKSDKVYIYVHGKMSDKESAGTFARIAENKGYQTINFECFGIDFQHRKLVSIGKYYHSRRESGHQRTPNEYAKDFKKFVDEIQKKLKDSVLLSRL